MVLTENAYVSSKFHRRKILFYQNSLNILTLRYLRSNMYLIKYIETRFAWSFPNETFDFEY